VREDSPGTLRWPIEIVEGTTRLAVEDPVVVEEPLHLRARSPGGDYETLGLTMRTPGEDRDLALGFLYGEGIIQGAEDVLELEVVLDPRPRHQGIDVTLREGCLGRFESRRLLVVSSACGVCGKAAVDAVTEGGLPPLSPGPVVPFDLLCTLPDRMREYQQNFERTGGIHAAALFDGAGRLEILREDVGRHNAVDKVVGARLSESRLPLADRLLLVSGRLGFEIVQKAARAGIPFVASVGAPTTLALRLAARAGMTVVGFLRDGRANVYSGGQRLRT
jgi:FdhD protein